MHKQKLRRGNIDRSDVERALLTDTGPDDVPIVVSNDGFHANMRRLSSSEGLKKIIDGLIRSNVERYTVPYRYRIRLSSTTSRQLSLIHPAAQFRSAAFYGTYAHLIPYFCRHGDVSLRRPCKIGSSIFYLTRTSEKKKYKGAAIDVLLQDHTVRNPGSFFAYDGVDRFYKFFDSEDFVRLEKKFSFMRITDITKCFSSIYSHSLAWAVKDVPHGKENVAAVSFANDFDGLMQFSNYNETNGIPVGAEISRIFAEILLQSADAGLLRRAARDGLVHERDFVVRRYIDDYVILANDVGVLDAVQRGLVEVLEVFKLHLNEAKTSTIYRPLQTRKSQIISEAALGLEKFRSRVSGFDVQSRLCVPNKVRDPASLVTVLVKDIKVACVGAGAGYEEVSAYVVGAIANTIESLIESFSEVKKRPDLSPDLYVGAFIALLSAMYFFFTVHVTVAASYRVAKATILSVRFFDLKLPKLARGVHELVRALVGDLIASPTLSSLNVSDYVPIEIMNIVLASSELPSDYRVDLSDIRDRILSQERVDYFSYISLIFYSGDSDPDFLKRVELVLSRKFLPHASPRKNSHDAHFMLDLIACPYLSLNFRGRVLAVLERNLEMSRGLGALRILLLREIEEHPWFVNWRQIDLLNQLRKKELSAAY